MKLSVALALERYLYFLVFHAVSNYMWRIRQAEGMCTHHF